VVGNIALSKWFYQAPNAHVRISWILLRNAMAAAAVKKIHRPNFVTLANPFKD
jgi:hypothetical protein